MNENVIRTSSYSEAMDMSDLEDSNFEQEQTESQMNTENTEMSPATQTQNSNNTNTQDPPVKIRKKPGRKPNPASPALRKAQNRAAQRAFRERKERHMKDLESNIKNIKAHRDKLLQENQKMSSENEILRAENWYLKGIVLSLQLVCLQHNLVIPQHCPHVNEQTLSVLAQSIPESISSYLNVSSKNKLRLSHHLKSDPSNMQGLPQQQQQHSQFHSPSAAFPSNQLASGSLIITRDGVHSDEFSNMPSLSPMPLSEPDDNRSSSPMNTFSPEVVREIPPPRPTMLPNEPITSNLAAIQTLRLRLRLQSACVSMQSVPFAIQPTLLQLTIPHDPRIDLIPTPHMRDRMILYRDLFDLDDCFRCLLSSSVFHGGDPAVAGNWQLPAEFFEKYWFLTIDYNLRRYTNEWRKKQGLKEIPTLNKNEKQLSPSLSTSSSHTSTATLTTAVPPPSQQPPQQPPQQQPATFNMPFNSQQPTNTRPSQPPPIYMNPPNSQPIVTTAAMNHNNKLDQFNTYDELTNYFGLQLNMGPSQQQQSSLQIHPPPPPQQGSFNVTPVQLTDGYHLMNNHNNTNTSNNRPATSTPLNHTTFPLNNAHVPY
ncbi:MAG: hypothetical protein EXX96DRAFT_509784 [Benjaminiella poitrasii]|nr:MAG: hypothetical protein EXX96DRAFT_509784 [Benjaminiella poitrasii]